MNHIRRWFNERTRVRVEAERALGVRLDALVQGLRDRLPSYRLASIVEYSDQAEFEIAIESVWAEIAGGLMLTATEREELAELARKWRVILPDAD